MHQLIIIISMVTIICLLNLSSSLTFLIIMVIGLAINCHSQSVIKTQNVHVTSPLSSSRAIGFSGAAEVQHHLPQLWWCPCSHLPDNVLPTEMQIKFAYSCLWWRVNMSPLRWYLNKTRTKTTLLDRFLQMWLSFHCRYFIWPDGRAHTWTQSEIKS